MNVSQNAESRAAELSQVYSAKSGIMNTAHSAKDSERGSIQSMRILLNGVTLDDELIIPERAAGLWKRVPGWRSQTQGVMEDPIVA